MIYSANNKKIKEILKLTEIKNIKKQNRYLVDGLHLVEEALKSNTVECVIKSESFDKQIHYSDEIETFVVEDKVIKLLTDTVNAQGIFAVCKIEDKTIDLAKYSNILILDRVQDPGNLGTIIRTADAFAFDAVILSKGTTNLFAQKVIRSMQGSNFHIDCFYNIDIEELLKTMTDYDIIATTLDTDTYLENMKLEKNKTAIILGNEANGISDEVVSLANKKIKISMPGDAESLNVAVSAGIVMHYVKNILKQ